MKQYEKTARFTRYATRFVMLVVAGLLLSFPYLVEQYHRHFRLLTDMERIAIVGGFYGCSGWVLWALRMMDRILGNILAKQLFVRENVKAIDAICLCCAAVSVICLCAGFGFPSLIFLSIIMAFLSMAVSVVCQVMKAAVELREESDLTI